jgi:hypothetical protein
MQNRIELALAETVTLADTATLLTSSTGRFAKNEA